MPELGFNPVLLIAFGVFVGVFSGVMGLGGGAVMVPMLLPAHEIISVIE